MQQPDADGMTTLAGALAAARGGDFSQLDAIAAALALAGDAALRLEAARCCRHIGFSAAVPPLAAMALRDPEPDNRNQAIFALVGVGRPAVVPALIAVLDDEDVERRIDARVALYRLLGPQVLPIVNDEDGGIACDPQEGQRVAAWWRARAAHYDPGHSYALGQPASPGVFVDQLARAGDVLPETSLDALRDWTGQDFGRLPPAELVAAWTIWWAGAQARYAPGQRYFHGHPVP